jgi:hypothetical protein
MKTISQEILNWVMENTIFVKDEDGNEYNIMDLNELKNKLEELNIKENNQMKKYKVQIETIEKRVYTAIIEAKNEQEAKELVETDMWNYVIDEGEFVETLQIETTINV